MKELKMMTCQQMKCMEVVSYPMMELKLNVSANDMQGFFSLSNDGVEA